MSGCANWLGSLGRMRGSNDLSKKNPLTCKGKRVLNGNLSVTRELHGESGCRIRGRINPKYAAVVIDGVDFDDID
jgi:hypothetical protein